jgi:hypothetical protein
LEAAVKIKPGTWGIQTNLGSFPAGITNIKSERYENISVSLRWD